MLLEIYPARELPIEGVNSSWLLDKITSKKKQLVTKEKLLTSFENSDAEVYITIGAGDIGVMITEITSQLLKKNKYEI